MNSLKPKPSKSNRSVVDPAPFDQIKNILLVLSSRSIGYDQAALRNFVGQAYPGSAVFFISVSGDPVGATAPDRVDLTIDFSPPGARQGFWFAWNIRRRSRFAVGRSVGLWVRNKQYDRCYNERQDQINGTLPKDFIEAEVWVQKKVLFLAGVAVNRQGGVVPDRSKTIANDLPRV